MRKLAYLAILSLCISVSSCHFVDGPNSRCQEMQQYWMDLDGDGLGLQNVTTIQCEPPEQGIWVTNGVDLCEDSAALNWNSVQATPCDYGIECAPFAYQGYEYDVVAIGNRCWMAEDLRCFQTRDGDELEVVTTFDLNSGTLTNGPLVIQGSNHSFYYNFDAVRAQLCPEGWMLPAHNQDWNTSLLDAVNEYALRPGWALQATEGWEQDMGTNSSGFGAVPHGIVDFGEAQLKEVGTIAGYWGMAYLFPNLSTEHSLLLIRNDGTVQAHGISGHPSKIGLACRCYKRL